MERDAEPADIVLINYGLVDAWITSIPAIYIPYYPDNFVRKQARKVLKSVKRRLRSDLARRIVPVGPVVPLDEYLRHMRRIVNLPRTRYPGVCVILWGTAPALEQPERTASIHRYNEALRQLAGELRAPYVDTAALIADLEPRLAYQDQTHLHAASAQRIASAMAAQFLSHAARGRSRRRAA
jgi:lysophospholipase L1-like esterase